jgi:hypothetical protein
MAQAKLATDKQSCRQSVDTCFLGIRAYQLEEDSAKATLDIRVLQNGVPALCMIYQDLMLPESCKRHR